MAMAWGDLVSVPLVGTLVTGAVYLLLSWTRSILPNPFKGIAQRLPWTQNQVARLANQKLLQSAMEALRENVLPSAGAIEAMMDATAREHQVARRYLLDQRTLAQAMIREVMASGLVSPRDKALLVERIWRWAPDDPLAVKAGAPPPLATSVALVVSIGAGAVAALAMLAYIALRSPAVIFEGPWVLVLFTVMGLAFTMAMRLRALRKERP